MENLKTSIMSSQEHSPANRKKLISTVVGIFAFGLSYFVVQQVFFQKPSYDQEMMAVASELNKSCPIMVDSETQLNNAVALPNNTFQYNYTLVNTDLSVTNVDELREYLTPNVTNYVKTSPDMKYMRDHGTTISYYYQDKAKQHLFTISVTPDKYR